MDGVGLRCLWGWCWTEVFVGMVLDWGVCRDGVGLRCLWGWCWTEVFVGMVLD